jgi:hypothetical protein
MATPCRVLSILLVVHSVTVYTNHAIIQDDSDGK